jgi:hypothetical protein
MHDIHNGDRDSIGILECEHGAVAHPRGASQPRNDVMGSLLQFSTLTGDDTELLKLCAEYAAIDQERDRAWVALEHIEDEAWQITPAPAALIARDSDRPFLARLGLAWPDDGRYCWADAERISQSTLVPHDRGREIGLACHAHRQAIETALAYLGLVEARASLDALIERWRGLGERINALPAKSWRGLVAKAQVAASCWSDLSEDACGEFNNTSAAASVLASLIAIGNAPPPDMPAAIPQPPREAA